MPSIAAHMACAKVVAELLKIDDPNFIVGNIYPDITCLKNSHYKIKGKYFYVPNIEYYKNLIKEYNNFELGYLCHLYLDKYFLNDFVINNVANFEDVFVSGKIYDDYTRINNKLVEDYNIDVDKISNTLYNINDNVDILKRDKNINYLFGKNNEKTEVIDYLIFKNYLNKINVFIANRINIDRKRENDKCYKLRHNFR